MCSNRSWSINPFGSGKKDHFKLGRRVCSLLDRYGNVLDGLAINMNATEIDFAAFRICCQ